MAKHFRIGIIMDPIGPYWVQVRLEIEHLARKLDFDLIQFDILDDDMYLPKGAFLGLVENLVAREIDALIIQDLPEPIIKRILDENIPIITLIEMLDSVTLSDQQGNLASQLMSDSISRLICDFLLEKMNGQGNVLIVGGKTLAKSGQKGVGEDGANLVDRISKRFAFHSSIQLIHIPTSWDYEAAYSQILTQLPQFKEPPDAIIGFSDTLALLARSVAEQMDLLAPKTLVIGVNGDPQALEAISRGNIAATIEMIVAAKIPEIVVKLALQAAAGQPLPRYYGFETHLITAENVTEVAFQKLMAIAELPNLLVGVNRQREQVHLTQLEKNLVVNQQIGAILDRQDLSHRIVNSIRELFNYDRVQLFLWSEASHILLLLEPLASLNTEIMEVHLEDDCLFALVLKSGELIFVPDVRNNQSLNADAGIPALRSRIVLPLRFGGEILGLLDLQLDNVTPHTRQQLLGLQIMTDQVAMGIRNTELYSDALASKKLAEKAAKLKTRLLANVSHEYKTPLNVILGYTRRWLSISNPSNRELEIISDLNRVYRSGEHLLHLTNDLLDLSRAEIDELEITPEITDIRLILEEAFQSIASFSTDQELNPVSWQFETPQYLPLLEVDPVRLHQILLNLLSNARKFTPQGHITLGVDLRPPYIHFWVEDTGVGISPEQQEQIFEPFMVGENSQRHSGGIGLGLTITRHLIALHGGHLTLESEPAKGSTFHVYLPLPNLSGQLQMPSLPTSQDRDHLNLVCISNYPELPPEVELLKQQENIRIYRLCPAEVEEELLKLHPSILAWDTTTAREKDWLVMDYLRNTPSLARLPLILYGNISPNTERDHTTGTTNILPKPYSGQTLQLLLESLRPNFSQSGVLLVDDDIENLNLYQQLVESALPGLVIHRAVSGQEALALLKEIVPALVIIDLVMPEVDGIEVVEWLRTHPPTRKVPIIVISGKVLSPEQIERLEFTRVIFQSKDMLNAEEAGMVFQQALDGKVQLRQFNSTLVKRAVAYLQTNYMEALTLQKVVQELGVTTQFLEKNFKQELGISPWEFLNRYRIKEAKRLLETTNHSVTVIAEKVGFEDPAYFSRVFRSNTGLSPIKYRKNSG